MPKTTHAAGTAAAPIARQLSFLFPTPACHTRRAVAKLQHARLTRRQLEILQLVAHGHMNREIAGALFLSTRTVEMHVGDILSRLDCHTRTAAVHKAGQLRLLQTA